MNKTGKCQLCLDEPVELRSSHFFPKAAYKIMREEAIRTGWRMNPNPVLMTDRSAVQTSEQYTARLLCHRCEQRFSAKRGELGLKALLEGEDFLSVILWLPVQHRTSLRPMQAFIMQPKFLASTHLRSHTSPQVCSGVQRSTVGAEEALNRRSVLVPTKSSCGII